MRVIDEVVVQPSSLGSAQPAAPSCSVPCSCDGKLRIFSHRRIALSELINPSLRHSWIRFIKKSFTILGYSRTHRVRASYTGTSRSKVCKLCKACIAARLAETSCSSHCRLSLPSNTDLSKAAFSRIKELQINSTMTTWQELRLLVGYMPSLRLIEAGYNRLHSLAEGRNVLVENADVISTLHGINLDGNLLREWFEVCSALTPFVRWAKAVSFL